MRNNLAKTGTAILSDIAGFFGMPTNVLGKQIDDYLKRRGDEALDILLEELRAGRIDEFEAASDDDAIGVIVRYGVAVRDGTARQNLRLMAKAMAGLAHKGVLRVDEFDKFSATLCQLSREQIILLGYFMAAFKDESELEPDGIKATSAAKRTVEGELIPSVFPTKDHMEVAALQCVSMGLLGNVSLYGSMGNPPTVWLKEITELVDFRDALRAEGFQERASEGKKA